MLGKLKDLLGPARRGGFRRKVVLDDGTVIQKRRAKIYFQSKAYERELKAWYDNPRHQFTSHQVALVMNYYLNEGWEFDDIDYQLWLDGQTKHQQYEWQEGHAELVAELFDEVPEHFMKLEQYRARGYTFTENDLDWMEPHDLIWMAGPPKNPSNRIIWYEYEVKPQGMKDTVTIVTDALHLWLMIQEMSKEEE